ncbi:MAG: hypothetical protein ACYDB7_07950 [Mycobacteriales bacterium]
MACSIGARFVAAAVTLGLAAGCSSGTKPATRPTPTLAISFSSAAAAPAVGAPPAEPETPAGAAAFVRAYFAESNRVYDTNDTSQIRLYSLPSCSVCNYFFTNIERNIAPRGRLVGGRYVLIYVRPDSQILSGLNTVSVRAYINSQMLVTNSGTLLETVPGIPPTTLAFFCSWTRMGWRISRIFEPGGS